MLSAYIPLLLLYSVVAVDGEQAEPGVEDGGGRGGVVVDVIGWSVLCKTCSSPAGTAQVLKSAFYFLSRQMSLLST